MSIIVIFFFGFLSSHTTVALYNLKTGDKSHKFARFYTPIVILIGAYFVILFDLLATNYLGGEYPYFSVPIAFVLLALAWWFALDEFLREKLGE